MKNIWLLAGLLVLAGCNGIGQEITDFDSCAAAGNPVMESYPRQCRANGITYVEDISERCTPEQRQAEICTTDYNPVCATVNVQCITTPCPPVRETFSNACGACSNSLVEFYVPGECPLE